MLIGVAFSSFSSGIGGSQHVENEDNWDRLLQLELLISSWFSINHGHTFSQASGRRTTSIDSN
jgi:hypothetical protein